MHEYSSHDSEFIDKVASMPGGKGRQLLLVRHMHGGMPVAGVEKITIQAHHAKSAVGMKEDVLGSSEIWQCSQCHVCVAHCPQDVRLADVIRALRRMAADEGYVPGELADEVERLDIDMRKQRVEKIKELTRRKL